MRFKGRENQRRQQGPDTGTQLTLTGKIRDNSVGGELITFTIPLGFFELTCLVNIPEEGSSEAPVYVKFRASKPERKPNPRHQRREPEVVRIPNNSGSSDY